LGFFIAGVLYRPTELVRHAAAQLAEAYTHLHSKLCGSHKRAQANVSPKQTLRAKPGRSGQSAGEPKVIRRG